MKVLASILTLILFVMPASAITYVSATATNGSNSGTDWTNAYFDVESIDGLPEGTEIWIAAATYMPSNSIETGGQSIYGGFNGSETNRDQRDPDINLVVLDGFMMTGPIFNMIQGANTTTVDGISFINASNTVNGGTMFTASGNLLHINDCVFSNNWANNGAGIYLNPSGGSSIITDCLFANNTANFNGGGLHNNSGDCNQTNNLYIGNASLDGGGMTVSNLTSPLDEMISNCTFTSNFAANGAGAKINSGVGAGTVTFDGCNFMYNIAATRGGGLWGSDRPAIILEDCIFSFNQATNANADGGAYANSGGENSADFIAVDCDFIGNSCADRGGTLYNDIRSSMYLTNCLIVEGESGTGAGSYHILVGGYKAYFENCTIATNVASGSGGGLSVVRGTTDVVNCIFKYNLASGSEDHINTAANGDTEISYTLINTNATTGLGPLVVGDGIFDDDPLFIGDGDYHLQSTHGQWNGSEFVQGSADSPCIDAGNPASVFNQEGLSNGKRINLGRYGNRFDAARSAGIWVIKGGKVLAPTNNKGVLATP